jgi:3-oxoacyl-(acyl-carrier-protein) synthase
MSASQNGHRRAVITGLGAVSPLGNDVETTWANVIAGKSGAGPITHFDSSDYSVHFACEVKDFDPEDWIDRKTLRRSDAGRCVDRDGHRRLAVLPGLLRRAA